MIFCMKKYVTVCINKFGHELLHFWINGVNKLFWHMTLPIICTTVLFITIVRKICHCTLSQMKLIFRDITWNVAGKT